MGVKDHCLAETLLYLASERGRRPMPFDSFLLTAAIAAALYEYLTGRIDFPEKFRDKAYKKFSPAWYQDSFNKWLAALLEEHGTKLNPGLGQAFRDLLAVSWVPRDGPSDGYSTNGVNDWKHHMIQFGHFSGVYREFNFTVSEAESAGEHIKRELSEEECNHCGEIARLMQKHIESS